MSLLAKIYQVMSIEVSMQRGKQNVISTGKTKTLGYTNGVLLPVTNDEPNGNFEFNFVATLPSVPSGDALGEISATYEFQMVTNVKSVTIHTVTNTLQWTNNQLSEDPYQSDMYIAASKGINGIIGITSSGKIATNPDLFQTVLGADHLRKSTHIKSLSRTEIGRLFDNEITGLMRQTNTGPGIPMGSFKSLALFKDGNYHEVLWVNDGDIPSALADFHRYLSDLS